MRVFLHATEARIYIGERVRKNPEIIARPGHRPRTKNKESFLPHCREGRVGKHPRRSRPGSRCHTRTAGSRLSLFLFLSLSLYRPPTFAVVSGEGDRPENKHRHTSSRSRYRGKWVDKRRLENDEETPRPTDHAG